MSRSWYQRLSPEQRAEVIARNVESARRRRADGRAKPKTRKQKDEHNTYKREWRRNPEQAAKRRAYQRARRAYQRARRASESPEEREARLAKRRANRKPSTDEQKAAAIERHQKWREANREKWRAITRKASSRHAKIDRKRNPAKWAEIDANHQARRRAGKKTGYVTTAEWRVILECFDHRCAYCGRAGVKLTQDHVMPLARGGEHLATNIVPACGPCNTKKWARGPLAMVNVGYAL